MCLVVKWFHIFYPLKQKKLLVVYRGVSLNPRVAPLFNLFRRSDEAGPSVWLMESASSCYEEFKDRKGEIFTNLGAFQEGGSQIPWTSLPDGEIYDSDLG